MELNNLDQYSSQELLKKRKRLKLHKIFDATFIGITIGTLCYSIIKDGFSFFTCIPIITGYIILKNAIKNNKLDNGIKAEIHSRNG